MNILKGFIYRNKWLIGILFICFVLSIGYSFYYQIKPQVDARAYDAIAQNIASGNGYREAPMGNDASVIRVGPIYEYFLAGIYKTFGHSYPAVWIIQAMLRVFSALFLYFTVLLIFKEDEHKKQIALWASAFFAFYPDLIEISAMLMTETLYLFFVCLLIYLFFKYIDSPNKSLLVGLGIVSGLAVLARPPDIVLFADRGLLLFSKIKNGKKLLFIFLFYAPSLHLGLLETIKPMAK